MFILFCRRIIGLALFISGIGFAILPIGSARADWNDPAVQYGYPVTRTDPAVFQATDGNERLRLKKLADIERASAPAVHRDTAVNADYMCDWAYDKVLGRWVCERNYMKAYVYTHPRPIPVCPFGYKLDYGGSACVRILYPQNAHLNARGDGWECNPGYHTNLTGTVCLGPEHVYRQYSSASSGYGTQKQVAWIRPMLVAAPVVINQTIVVQATQGTRTVIESEAEAQPKPARLPSTGPSVGILFVLSAFGARKLLRK